MTFSVNYDELVEQRSALGGDTRGRTAAEASEAVPLAANSE
jgi:hypothetical protein